MTFPETVPIVDTQAAWLLAIAGGAVVGTLYFAGLWWTVQRAARTSHPVMFVAGSFLIRGMLAAALLATGVAAQDIFGGWGRFRDPTPRLPTADSFDGWFNFCRGMFYSSRREAGGQGWWTDYPAADVNFSIRLSELTKTRVSRTPNDEPNHLVVRLTDPELFQCPFLILSDPGTAGFTDEEAARLRAYLLKGGFMWADDFWGTAAWQRWESEIGRVLPPFDYPIADLTPDHPIFRTMFSLKEIPQIPNIGHWRRSGGGRRRITPSGGFA